MKRTNLLCLAFAFALAMQGCQPTGKQATGDADSSASLHADTAKAPADQDLSQGAQIFTLKNGKGMKATFTNFGARIVSLTVPDKQGKMTDVVLGFEKAASYNNPEEPYFGTIVGPFGNRIAKGKFTLDGVTYTLPTNNGGNTLHGGFKGVHFALWKASQTDEQKLTFTYTLPDGNEGFPGNINITVVYTLNDANELAINYQATTDKNTVINLTNHAYFNLNGEGKSTILNHSLKLYADTYTPVDKTLIPTGELATVKGTPFDFTTAKRIGRDIDEDNTQLKYGKGYDHNFVLNGTVIHDFNYAASVIGDLSGIKMDIYTKEPGIQFYSGNFMAEKVTLKSGVKDAFRTGFCLEPQHFPDSPNQAQFPSTLLKAGDTYNTTSIYKFSINK